MGCGNRQERCVYVGLARSVPTAWNERLLKQLSGAGEIGHDLLERAPAAARVTTDEAVRDAVERLAGPAVLDACRHVHVNDSATSGPWHQDDYCGQPWPPGERYVIVCYFPQDTTPEMGPTAVRLPNGTQQVAAGTAGTFVAMRHDVRHRATANVTGRERVMLKFLYRGSDDKAGDR